MRPGRLALVGVAAVGPVVVCSLLRRVFPVSDPLKVVTVIAEGWALVVLCPLLSLVAVGTAVDSTRACRHLLTASRGERENVRREGEGGHEQA